MLYQGCSELWFGINSYNRCSDISSDLPEMRINDAKCVAHKHTWITPNALNQNSKYYLISHIMLLYFICGLRILH